MAKGSHGVGDARASMAESGGRVLRANSPVLLVSAASMVALIIVVSGLMSFQAQMELAGHAGIPEAVAWGWPVIVDGTVIVGTVAVLLLTPRGRGKAAYAWLVLCVFGLVTVAANGVHATGAEVPLWARFGIGAVPAVALLLSTHLFVLMLTSPEIQVERVIVKREVVEVDEVRSPEPSSTAPVSGPVSVGGAGYSPEEVEAWILTELHETGELPSGTAVGERLGKSRSAGSRFRSDLAARNAEVAAALNGRPLLREVSA